MIAKAGVPGSRISLYDIPVTTLEGEPASLAPYRGQVLLIVNVASECGFTPQYEALESRYRRHRDRGFSVLGFPCKPIRRARSPAKRLRFGDSASGATG
jgi:glutathione peroxidase-family protein